MQTPLRVTFHQLPPSAALEAQVRAHVDGLETIFDRIVTCRVSISKRLPGTTTTAASTGFTSRSASPEGRLWSVARRTNTRRTPIEYVAVNDAFRAARRKLEDYVRRLRGDAESHVGLPAGAYRPSRSPTSSPAGLPATTGREIYFHRNSVRGGIERLALGAEVRFHEAQGDKGPQATTVEPIGAHGHHVA